MAASRTPEIVADAAYEILRQPPSAASGNTFLDDDVLTAAGITDLSGYTAGDSDAELALDLFVDPAPADRLMRSGASTVDGVAGAQRARCPTASRCASRDRSGPTRSSTRRSPAPPARCWRIGPRGGRPRRRLRPQLRRLPDRLPRLRARRAGPRAGQLRPHRRRAGLPARAVRQPRASLVDPALRRAVDAVRRPTAQVLRAARRRRTRLLDARRARATSPSSTRDVADDRPRPAALHLRHHVAAQGRDDDPPRAGARVRLVHRTRSTCAEDDEPLHSHAALPLGADARVPAAVPRGRRDQPPDGGARRPARSCAGSRPTGIGALFARPDGVGARWPTTPTSTTRDLSSAAQGLLRRVDHARARAGAAARARCPSSAFYNCFGQSRDRPAGHRAAARGARRRGPTRAGARCCSWSCGWSTTNGERRRARRQPARSSTARRSCATGYWDKPGGDRRGLPGRLVPLRRPRAPRRRGLHHRRRPDQGRHQHRRRAGRLPRGRGRALHPPGRGRGRRDRHCPTSAGSRRSPRSWSPRRTSRPRS